MKRFLLTAGALSAIATATTAQPVNVEAERAALRQANVAYCQALLAKDAARLTAMYGNSASLFPPNEASLSGPDGVRTWASGFVALPELTIRSCAPVQVDVSGSGDLGYTLFTYDLSFRGPNGQPVRDPGRDLMVWRKQPDGSWKIVLDIWNSELPATPPPR